VAVAPCNIGKSGFAVCPLYVCMVIFMVERHLFLFPERKVIELFLENIKNFKLSSE